MKSMIVFAVLSLSAASLAFANDDHKATHEPKPGKCCAAAAKEGKTCAHECCVAAAKEGKNCEKCGGSGEIEHKK